MNFGFLLNYLCIDNIFHKATTSPPQRHSQNMLFPCIQHTVSQIHTHSALFISAKLQCPQNLFQQNRNNKIRKKKPSYIPLGKKIIISRSPLIFFLSYLSNIPVGSLHRIPSFSCKVWTQKAISAISRIYLVQTRRTESLSADVKYSLPRISMNLWETRMAWIVIYRSRKLFLFRRVRLHA